jgi:hypothetical protein
MAEVLEVLLHPAVVLGLLGALIGYLLAEVSRRRP